MDFLRNFQEIIDCHVVEFFTGRLFAKVPEKVVEQCENLNAENFQNYKEIFSLKKFTLDSFSEVEVVNLPGELDQLYTDCMNKKKIHEVAIMAQHISNSLDKSQERILIDGGSGLGYLSSWLAFNYNFKVLSIDSRAGNSQSAEKRLEKFAKKVKHLGVKKENHKIHTEFIDDRTNFQALAMSNFPDSVAPQLTLTGLHTCGSLSNNCLRIFRKVKEIRDLFNVGCCYNLLEENDFPMSEYASGLDFKLTRNARMLAAYSADRVFSNSDVSNVEKIFYRALLEKLLGERHPEVKVKNLGPIKAKNFVEYVENAQKARPEMFADVKIEGKVAEEFLKENEKHWKEMLIFYLFRMSFAPVIEAAILLDKVMYLLESEETQRIQVNLVKLFDPVVSPRCFLIQANKEIKG